MYDITLFFSGKNIIVDDNIFYFRVKRLFILTFTFGQFKYLPSTYHSILYNVLAVIVIPHQDRQTTDIVSKSDIWNTRLRYN